MAWDLGSTVERTVQVRDASGAPAAADVTPAYSVRLPDGTPGVAPPVTAGAGLGEYQVAYPTTVAGLHWDSWAAVVGGLPQAFGPYAFDVRRAAPPPLLSLEDARTLLGVGAGDADRDQAVRDYVDAATADVERATGFTYRRQTITGEQHPHTGYRHLLRLRRLPVASVSEVTDDAGLVDPVRYVVYGDIGLVEATAGGFAGSVAVTYEVGPAVVDDDVLGAVRLQLQHKWSTRSGSSSVPRRSTGVDPLYAEAQRALDKLPKAPALA